MDQSVKTIQSAKDVFSVFAKNNPKCKHLVDFVWNNRNKIMNSKSEELEVKYHDGEALPKHADDCHDIKELGVHPVGSLGVPIRVRILGSNPKLKMISKTNHDEQRNQ